MIIYSYRRMTKLSNRNASEESIREAVLDWLAKQKKNKRWLAAELGVEERTVDSWFSWRSIPRSKKRELSQLIMGDLSRKADYAPLSYSQECRKLIDQFNDWYFYRMNSSQGDVIKDIPDCGISEAFPDLAENLDAFFEYAQFVYGNNQSAELPLLNAINYLEENLEKSIQHYKKNSQLAEEERNRKEYLLAILEDRKLTEQVILLQKDAQSYFEQYKQDLFSPDHELKERSNALYCLMRDRLQEIQNDRNLKQALFKKLDEAYAPLLEKYGEKGTLAKNKKLRKKMLESSDLSFGLLDSSANRGMISITHSEKELAEWEEKATQAGLPLDEWIRTTLSNAKK